MRETEGFGIDHKDLPVVLISVSQARDFFKIKDAHPGFVLYHTNGEGKPMLVLSDSEIFGILGEFGEKQ